VVYAIVFTTGALYILRLLARGPELAYEPRAPGRPRAPGSPLAAAPEADEGVAS
jgi:cytochrome d ubiquinol oxidase subunit I